MEHIFFIIISLTIAICSLLYSFITLMRTIYIEKKTASILRESLQIEKRQQGKTIVVKKSNQSQFEKAQREVGKLLEKKLSDSEFNIISSMLNQKSIQGQINYMNKLMENSKKNIQYSYKETHFSGI